MRKYCSHGENLLQIMLFDLNFSGQQVGDQNGGDHKGDREDVE